MRGAHLTGWSIALVAVLSAGASVTAAERQSELAARGEVSRSKVPLIKAVQQRNTASVRALLGRGVDVNASEPDGTTALHWAAHQGDLDVLDLLLGAGVNVRAASRYGVTPLPLACENGNAAVIERLLIAGADPNVVLPGGQTALMTAARTGRADAVKVLLAHGADANATEGLRGQTALMWAAANGHAAAAAVLLAGGADRDATSHGPAKAVTGLDIYARPTRGLERLDVFTPFLFAVQAGHLDAARVLVDHGADVNDTATDGTSALVLAIANGHYDLAAFLLDNGADPNAARQGWNALVQEVRTKNPSVGQAPPLVPTSRLSPVELAAALIGHGVDVDARITQQIRDRYRTHMSMTDATAYVMAAKVEDAEMMRLLLAAGADPRAKTEAGRTALMVASGVDMWYVDEDSGTNEDALEAVEVALAACFDVNAVNDDGETALHGAAFRGSNEIVQLLVDRGATLDVQNTLGFTPLMIANGDQIISCNLQRRPWTVELLTTLMTERGIPARVRSVDEKFADGVSRGYSNVPTPPTCGK